MIKQILIGAALVALILGAAIWAQDPYGCPQEDRDACLWKIITDQGPSQQLCQELGTEQGQCYFILAEQSSGSERLTYCQQSNQPDQCLFHAALATRNKDLCQSINLSLRTLCLRSLA